MEKALTVFHVATKSAGRGAPALVRDWSAARRAAPTSYCSALDVAPVPSVA
jgi:hypothetical protein